MEAPPPGPPVSLPTWATFLSCYKGYTVFTPT